MGHMGNGAHGQWGPWVMGTFWPITSLLLDGFLQTFSHFQLKPPQPAQGYFSLIVNECSIKKGFFSILVYPR